MHPSPPDPCRQQGHQQHLLQSFAVGPQLHEIAGKHPESRSPFLESAMESDTSEHAHQTRNFKFDCPAVCAVEKLECIF